MKKKIISLVLTGALTLGLVVMPGNETISEVQAKGTVDLCQYLGHKKLNYFMLH